VQFEGENLDAHGYLVDIGEMDAALEALIARYRDQTLNHLAEFSNLNPSLEHFARILCEALVREMKPSSASALTLKLWENDSAWASYRVPLQST
jgi:6-pyruvoyltetrahydropterin/6-carboxytetrahydropterin synthase